jgi:hypothetical protein
MLSLISKIVNPNRNSKKIHPESPRFCLRDSACTGGAEGISPPLRLQNPRIPHTKCSSSPEYFAIDTPRIETPRKDPCAQMYARYKEPGAYDKYQQLLLSNKV